MSNICRKVVVGGFSLGGGLAMDFAARVPATAAVFAVCPPMRLQDVSTTFLQALEIWNRLMEMAHYAGGKKEFVEISSEHPGINYGRVPIAGIRQLENFMTALVPKLATIQAPALVVQSSMDPVVSPEGSKIMFERARFPDKGLPRVRPR